MKKHRPFLAVALVGSVLLTGCDTENVSNTSSPGGSKPTETLLLLSPNANEQRTKAIKAAFFDFVGRVPTGSRIHLVVGPEHSHVASFEVPDGLSRSRIRKLKAVLATIHGAFDQPARGANGQVNLPAIAATVAKVRRTALPFRVAIYGSPLYQDDNQLGFSMGAGTVTTDGSIGHRYSPFQVSTRLPNDCKLVWVTPTADYGLDANHREAVQRFNGFYLQELHGSLLRTTDDPSLLFHFDTPVTVMRIAAIDSRPGVREVSVRTVAEEENKGISTFSFRTNEARRSGDIEDIESVLSSAEEDPATIAIAVNWSSTDPECDINLHLQSRDLPGELSFAQQTTTWGQYFNDMWSTSEIDASSKLKHRWEFVRVKHARLHDLTLYLNAYQTTAPARITVVRVWNGERRQRVFDMDVDEGDHGTDRDRAAESPAWIRVDLYAPPTEKSSSTGMKRRDRLPTPG